MVAKTETVVSNKLDIFKLGIALLFLVGGIVGFYYFQDQAFLYRVLGLLALVIVAVGVVYTTRLGQMIVGFGRESRAELRKVVWPTRQETVQTTMMVIFFTILLGLFLWIVDTTLLWAVQKFTGQGG